MEIIEYIEKYWYAHTWHALVPAGFIAFFLCSAFMWLIFATRLWWFGLRKSAKALEVIKGKLHKNTDGVELSAIERSMRLETLVYLWHEYEETLHKQTQVDEGTGQDRIIHYRATALAETFFTQQALVDTYLKTEFFKHLPGILTGIGIIGTFLGLITGLSNFNISNPAQVQHELGKLINTVGDAFNVSATAITIAIVFTFIERLWVTFCYHQVEKIAQLIDSLFDAGVGEEYLQRIVMASESQVTQALQIKEALVVDLKEIMATFTQRQIDAHASHANQISDRVGEAIAKHMGGPMAEIASSVKGVSTNQGEAVHQLLSDVLVQFSERLENTFGGQLHGMNDILKETSSVMRGTAEKFALLASDMNSAGKGAVDAMGERIGDIMTSMEARQQAMDQQMGEFVNQIRELVSASQTESSQKLQEALQTVGEQVAGVIAKLSQQAEEAADSQGRRQERFEENTSQVVSSLSSKMEGLLAQSVATNQSLQETVASLSQATNKAIDGMSLGADKVALATSNFAKAGQDFVDTIKMSSDVTNNIRLASDSLAVTMSEAKNVVADYRRNRTAFEEMVTEFKTVMDNARREASMTSEQVDRIESATRQLGVAQKQAEEYLQGINEVLVKVHESFASSIEQTLQKGNNRFKEELANAVDMLSGSIRDLEDALDHLPGRK
ncbi:MAG: anti-phage defense ZorAB system ZorA [Magnetococcales bacterium]|nr:anti-phage defense ZorAB system ZorA [Magnetococcales bacterium]